ncbi:MAG: DegV family protein [Ardenticatenales bacterium]|nr:DegV family protein [Ardenticatenales bacterium]
MSIKLIADGTVDMPQETIETYDITLVPISVIIDGEVLQSRVEISAEEFYKRQRTAKSLPTTSQPTPQKFVEAFEEALKTHDQVLCICASSGLSGTINGAKQAANQFPAGKIVIHDSMTIAGAIGFQLIAAAKAIKAGADMDAALAAVRKTHKETELFFAVDDLTYLIKGGRIGKVAGAVGSFLNIKPVITVDKSEGIYAPIARVRSFPSTMRKMVDLAAEIVGEGRPGRFMVLHGEMDKEAAEIDVLLRQRFDVKWLYTAKTSPAMGAHTGPRGMALVVAPGEWENQL